MTIMQRVQFQDVFDVVGFGTATLDPASLAADTGATVTVTITGAALGDFVLATPAIDAIDLNWSAYVQAADAVEVSVWNTSTAGRNLASATWNIVVLRLKAGAVAHS
ncbi:MAG: hypothetical protein ACE5LB_13345 [Acidiferrobacterales bacterium]